VRPQARQDRTARPAPLVAFANQRRQRSIFWIVLVGLMALIAFPWFAPLLLS
jgi:hypothetical protein